jgi:hypothetical protein
MRREPLPPELTRLVSPRALKGYASGLDWRPVDGINGNIAVYHRPDSELHQVIIATDTTLSDYDEVVAEAVRKLADFEKRPAREVLDHLLLPPAEVLSFREVSPDAEAGSLQLGHAAQFIGGTRKLLLSIAHSVLVPRASHPRLARTEAEDFINRCRLGQTDRGSFVINVACPLDAQLALPGIGEPFARQVTSLLLDTLADLARAADGGISENLIDPLRHRGISANLCESLLMLRPTGDRASLSVTATWSRTRLPAPPCLAAPGRTQSRSVCRCRGIGTAPPSRSPTADLAFLRLRGSFAGGAFGDRPPTGRRDAIPTVRSG